MAFVVHVNLLDGVRVRPRDVFDNLFWDVLNAIADLARGEYAGDFDRPKFEEVKTKIDCLRKVVVRFHGIPEYTAHHIEGLDLLFHEFHARKVGIVVSF